ncbi:MAG: protein phosphatase 2C domain-containing protein [Proteobacteria bacterium]|nr:protein phosphatase 2C domain-containing protein [Pseudomonadota bacterium]
MILQIQMSGASHVGRVRKMNQDSLLFDEAMGFCLVADGIGGKPGGEIASKIAVDTVSQGIWSSLSIKYSDVPAFMLEQVYKANLKILDYGTFHANYCGLGTTLDFAYFVGESLNFVHVGDSRVYVYYQNHFFQLTIDHNIENFAHRGLVQRRHDFIKKNGTKLTKGLGLTDDLEPDFFQKNIYPGEIYLLASDGLFDMVEDSYIKQVISQNIENLGRIPTQLISSANKNGGKDNISVVVCGIG